MAVSVKNKKIWISGRCDVLLSRFSEDVERIFGVAPRDNGPIIETRLRREVLFPLDASIRTRRKVMGRPYWYLNIIEVGPTRSQRDSTTVAAIGSQQGLESLVGLTVDEMTTRGAGIQPSVGADHTLFVSLYLEYKDDDDDDLSSTSVWDDMLEGTEPSKPGLLTGIRSLGVEMATSGNTPSLVMVKGWRGTESTSTAQFEDSKTILPLDSEAKELAHLLQFHIEIGDVI